MKTDILLLIYTLLSWGLGVLICGVSAKKPKKTAHTIFALIFFGGPIIGFGYTQIREKLIINSFQSAKREVEILCANNGGDKIYKKVDDVEGIFQIQVNKPYAESLLSDQYGMVNPYAYAQGDRDDMGMYVGYSSIFPESPPLGKQGYWFIEQQPHNGAHKSSIYRRSYLAKTDKSNDLIHTFIINRREVSDLLSRYGYLTEDITTKEMRDHWIGAGRIKIIDLKTNEVLAVRTGYYRASGDFLQASADRWSASGAYMQKRMCPSNDNLLHFLHSVLKPPKEYPTNEQLDSLVKGR